MRCAKLPIGTCPIGVCTRRSSIWSRLRRSGGKRTRMSTDLSLSTGRYSVALRPLVTSWTALPTVLMPAPYFAASDLSTSSFQSMPGSGWPSSRSRMSLRGQDGRDLVGRRRQAGGIERAELHLDRLAGRRTRARRRHLDEDARNVGGLGADGVHDFVRRRPAAPVRELKQDDADGVLGELAHAARLLAHAGVDGLEPVEGEHALLDLADETILLVEGEIAAGVYDHLAVVGLDLGEELDAAAEFSVGDLHRDQKERRQRQRQAGVAQRHAHRAHIGPAILRALVVGNRGRAGEPSERPARQLYSARA